jgi:hypothetical protein
MFDWTKLESREICDVNSKLQLFFSITGSETLWSETKIWNHTSTVLQQHFCKYFRSNLCIISTKLCNASEVILSKEVQNIIKNTNRNIIENDRVLSFIAMQYLYKKQKKYLHVFLKIKKKKGGMKNRSINNVL